MFLEVRELCWREFALRLAHFSCGGRCRVQKPFDSKTQGRYKSDCNVQCLNSCATPAECDNRDTRREKYQNNIHPTTALLTRHEHPRLRQEEGWLVMKRMDLSVEERHHPGRSEPTGKSNSLSALSFHPLRFRFYGYPVPIIEYFNKS